MWWPHTLNGDQVPTVTSLAIYHWVTPQPIGCHNGVMLMSSDYLESLHKSHPLKQSFVDPVADFMDLELPPSMLFRGYFILLGVGNALFSILFETFVMSSEVVRIRCENCCQNSCCCAGSGEYNMTFPISVSHYSWMCSTEGVSPRYCDRLWVWPADNVTL